MARRLVFPDPPILKKTPSGIAAASIMRRWSIDARERERLAEAQHAARRSEDPDRIVSSKYPRYEITLMKEIFDEYDTDNSGAIDLQEFKTALLKRKAALRHFHPLKKSTLAQRQAAGLCHRPQLERGASEWGRTGLFVGDHAASLFESLDKDRDGQLTFEELLRSLYPLATESEMSTMLHWVAPPRAPEEPSSAEDGLSRVERGNMLALFRMHDTNGDGQLSFRELRALLKNCCYDDDECERLFDEYDADGNNYIDLAEWEALLKSTGLSFCHDT